MIEPVNRLLEALEFYSDPFASTNADDEPQLADYFVPPPYFAAVRGDPRNPRPNIVLAPRGGGKTAQKRMIEAASDEQDFVCVAYDRFDVPTGFEISDATLEYHLAQICRLITVGILVALESDRATVDNLSTQQKRVLKFCAKRFLSDLTADEFQAAIRAVKNLGDKARDIWETWGGPIAGVVDVILERLKLRGVDVDQAFEQQAEGDESLRYLLQRLSEIPKALGFKSVYILVDKVDEFAATSTDASKTLEFVRPLLTDLPTLEQEGVGFKFFLWDAIQDDFQQVGVRRDRVAVHSLQWSTAELKAMIAQRLSAFSRGKITSLRALMERPDELDIDTLAAHLAAGSPRDLIRLMAAVVAEETRDSDQKEAISLDAFWKGIRRFSEERCDELFPGQVVEIRRVGSSGKVTFTVNTLANDIYRVTTQAARARVQGWMNTGLVSRIGELPNPGNRPMYLYGPVDLRLAIAMLANSPPDEVLANFALICPECEVVAITDATEVTCTGCSHRFNLAEARSLIEAAT